MLLKFVGTGIHVRQISKADFKNIGFNHEALDIDVRVDPFVEVSDDVAEWLLTNEKSDWKEATAKEAERHAVKTAPAEEEEPATATSAPPEKATAAKK